MVEEGHTVASLTGGIEGSARDAVIDKFRAGQAKVLITTNVLARGIDVSTVSMVINYVLLLPTDPQSKVRTTLLTMNVSRTSLKSTKPAPDPAKPTSKLTSTVSVAQADSAASVSPSLSSRTARNGKCSLRSRSTLTRISSVLTPRTGMRLRRLLRRRLRIPVLRGTLGGKVRLNQDGVYLVELSRNVGSSDMLLEHQIKGEWLNMGTG